MSYSNVLLEPINEVQEIEQILRGEGTIEENTDKFVFRKGTWLRLSPVVNEQFEDSLLLVHKRGAWGFNLYQPPTYEKQYFAVAHPQKGLFSPYHIIISLNSQTNQQTPAYIEIVRGNIDNNLIQVQSSELAKETQQHLVFVSGQRAIMLFIVLMALFLWIKLSSPIYLIYAVFVVCNTLMQSMQDGSFFLLALPEFMREQGHNIYVVAGSLGHVLVMSFLKRFLSLEKKLKVAAWILSATQLVSLAIFFGPLFGYSVYELGNIVNLAMAVSTLTVVLSCIYLVIWKRNRQAVYGLVGWSVFCLAGFNLILSSMGVVEDKYLNYMLFQLGSLIEMIVFQIGLADLALDYRKERDVAVELSIRDKLTGVYNRQGMDRNLPGFLDKNHHWGIPFSVAIVDIDHFKKVNDTHGHDIGDICIQTVAQRVQHQLRGDDLLVRFGGEEFVVVLSESDLKNANKITERILTAISDQPMALPDGSATESLSITVSIGVCQYQRNLGFETTLKLADQALYASKRNGRNKITVADSPERETIAEF